MKTLVLPAFFIVVLFAACTQPATKSETKEITKTEQTTATDSIVNTTREEQEPLVVGDRLMIFTTAGDLNKDNKPDSVVVFENVADSSIEFDRPRFIEIYFALDGGYKKVLSSDKAVANYSENTWLNKPEIKNGTLRIYAEVRHGHYENIFRYQNGQFEMIGHEDVEGDPDQLEELSYNLSTGRLIYKVTKGEKVTKNIDTQFKMEKVPALETYEPLNTKIEVQGTELYL